MIVVAGFGAVALVTDPGASAPTDTAPAVDTTEPAGTTTTGPLAELRFAEPLGEGIVASVEPAPATPTRAVETSSDLQSGDGDTWGYGIDATSTVWVVDGTEWVGGLTVMDMAVPWDIAANGWEQTRIGGVDAVIDGESSVALRLDDGTRRISVQVGNDPVGDTDLPAALLELAEYVGASPLADVLPTGRFVAPPMDTYRASTVVQYGGDETVDVLTLRFSHPPSADELSWTAASFARGGGVTPVGANTFESTLPTGQRSLLELVSPVDAVAVLAPADTNLTRLRNSLIFGTLEQIGVTLEDIDGPPTPNIAARGESTWGRWQVARSVDNACRSITAAEWKPGQLGSNGFGGNECDQSTPPESVVCYAPSADRMLVVVIGTDAQSAVVTLDGLPISQSLDNGDGGAAVMIEGIPSGAHSIETRTADGNTATC